MGDADDRVTEGYDQILELAAAVSKDGESPMPSSRSRDDIFQILQRSFNGLAPEFDELEEAEPAELQPELPENAFGKFDRTLSELPEWAPP